MLYRCFGLLLLLAAGLVIYGVGMNNANDGGEVIPTEDRHHAKDAGLVHGW